MEQLRPAGTRVEYSAVEGQMDGGARLLSGKGHTREGIAIHMQRNLKRIQQKMRGVAGNPNSPSRNEQEDQILEGLGVGVGVHLQLSAL